MRHFVAIVISCLYTLIKLCISKLFHFRCLYFTPVTRFSPNVRVTVSRKSLLRLGKYVQARSGAKIIAVAGGKLQIDHGSGLGYNSMIVCRHRIHIASNVQIGPNVLIYDHDHDFRVKGGIKAGKYRCDSVTIGENTWIGANTLILRGSQIGKNCVIAAGSVVNGIVPDNSMLVQKRDNHLSLINIG